MRTPERWAVAIRRPDASIHTEAHEIVERWPRLRRTFLRGPLALADAISTGMHALRIAMREASGVTVTPEQLRLTFAPVALGAFVVFVALPGVLTSGLVGLAGAVADAVEATTRAAMLLVYLIAIRRSGQTARLFGYHGAEHMAIAGFERRARIPTGAEVGEESPVHVRCGTNFIALFVIACGVGFSVVPRDPVWLGGVLRVVLVPVIAALAYEVMRATARRPNAVWSRGLTWPGRALQRITTRRPDADQIEIALAALTAAVASKGP